jgi:hypothetical protein
MRAVAETFSFLSSLAALPALYFVVVSFLTSPVIVAGWVLGFGRGIFAEPSDQAGLVIVFHIVTTALVLLLAWAYFAGWLPPLQWSR